MTQNTLADYSGLNHIYFEGIAEVINQPFIGKYSAVTSFKTIQL